MHFEYDLEIQLRADNYDFTIERAKYSVLTLSPQFEAFLRKLFAVHSFNKYLLSYENIRRIFEPLHSEFTSGGRGRVFRDVCPGVLRGSQPHGTRLAAFLAILCQP